MSKKQRGQTVSEAVGDGKSKRQRKHMEEADNRKKKIYGTGKDMPCD